VYTLAQVHSAELVEARPIPARREDGPSEDDPGLPKADGLILPRNANGLVAVQAADCVPVLVVHVASGEVAALHAGWRGAAAGILPRLLERWRRLGNLASVRLALGPSIRSCCYEVREDCLSQFAAVDLNRAVSWRGEHSYLDLTGVLRNQAVQQGLDDRQVETLNVCTFCARDRGVPVLASYRREGRPGEPYLARNAAYIGRWPDPD
jgi:YfiH family protein